MKELDDLKKITQEINGLSRTRMKIQKALTDKVITAIETKLGHKCRRGTGGYVKILVGDLSGQIFVFSIGVTGKVNFHGWRGDSKQDKIRKQIEEFMSKEI